MYDSKEFNELADKLDKNPESPKDISEKTRMLSKVAMEQIPEIKMEEHLGEKRVISDHQGIPETAVP